VSCVTPVNNFLLKELLNNCTQLSAADYVADSTLQLAQGDVVSLGTGRAGCYQVMGTTTLPATYMVDAEYADCQSCTPQTPVSYEVEECTTGATVYVTRTQFTLQPGYTVSLVNTPGCYTVLGDSTTVATDDVQQLFKGCQICQGSTGYIYYAYFCDGSTSPLYFRSTIALTQGTIVKVLDGNYAGKCVSIISQNQIGFVSGNLDVSVAYDDCITCQGLTVQTCHNIGTGANGATVSYIQNGNTFTSTLAANRRYQFCGSNFQVISGSATITDTGNLCSDNFSCFSVLRTSCHQLYGGTFAQGTTFDYQDSSGTFQTVNVVPYTYSTICAVINSVTISSGNGSYQDLQSLCLQDSDCEYPIEDIP